MDKLRRTPAKTPDPRLQPRVQGVRLQQAKGAQDDLPPGWRAAASKDFEGQCCQGTTDSANRCCAPDRIALLDNRCCGPDEVVADNRCKKSSDLPPLPPNLLCPFGQRTLLTMLSFDGIPRDWSPASRHQSAEAHTASACRAPGHQHLLNLNRPRQSETADALTSVTTAVGKANFDALVKTLKADPGLKVQTRRPRFARRPRAYNLDLGARRAQMIAEALSRVGIPNRQIARPPGGPRAECKPLTPGLVTCGKPGYRRSRPRSDGARVPGQVVSACGRGTPPDRAVRYWVIRRSEVRKRACGEANAVEISLFNLNAPISPASSIDL